LTEPYNPRAINGIWVTALTLINTEGEDMKVTMMELRREPGEWIHHQVWKHGKTVIITHCGKEIAQICPIETTTIDNKGRCHGAVPLTFQNSGIIK